VGGFRAKRNCRINAMSLNGGMIWIMFLCLEVKIIKRLLIREQNVKNVVSSIKHLMNFVACMIAGTMKNAKIVNAICMESLEELLDLEHIIEP
jgi:hypothetical protein